VSAAPVLELVTGVLFAHPDSQAALGDDLAGGADRGAAKTGTEKRLSIIAAITTLLRTCCLDITFLLGELPDSFRTMGTVRDVPPNSQGSDPVATK